MEYVVEQKIAGNGERLKEYQIGVDVFGRPASYNTRIDPVVRVEARQLRFRLAEYYGANGLTDAVAISVPKGGYAAEISLREVGAAPAQGPVLNTGTEPALAQPGALRLRGNRRALNHSPNRSPSVTAAALAILMIGVVGAGAYRSLNATPTHVSANPQARKLYLEGRYYWNKRTPADLKRSVDLFTRTIVEDPRYASAYVGLADAYNLMSEYSDMSYREAFDRALAAARRAVELDDASAEAHRAWAFALFYGAWNRPAAEREFERALQLNPKSAIARHWYATCLLASGRSGDALRQIEQAQELDPTSVSIRADKAVILATAGKNEESVALLKQMENSDPSSISVHQYLAEYYLEQRDYPNYLQEFRQAAVLSANPETAALATAGETGYRQGGARQMLEAILNVERKYTTPSRPQGYRLAEICARVGNKVEALRYLRTALEDRDPMLLGLPRDQTFDILRSNSDFRQILAAVNGA